MEGQKLRSETKVKINKKVTALYLIMVIGGVLNLTGWFPTLMNVVSGPFIIGFSLWIFWELVSGLDFFNNLKMFKKGFYKQKLRSVVIFFLIIIISGWLIEFIGTKTIYVFGSFSYTNKLLPQIAGVPLAIGFLWFTVFMSATGFVQNIPNLRYVVRSNIARAMITGLFTVIFDVFLESSADKLGYWTWTDNIVPFWNYISWFIFGTLMSHLSQKMEIIGTGFPKLAFHAYPAQLIFLILSHFTI